MFNLGIGMVVVVAAEEAHRTLDILRNAGPKAVEIGQVICPATAAYGSSRRARRVARILVVDDDPDIRLLLRLELSAEGYAIVEAGDGQAALTALEDESVDLVLLDIMMPVLDGWGVAPGPRGPSRAADRASSAPWPRTTARTSSSCSSSGRSTSS